MKQERRDELLGLLLDRGLCLDEEDEFFAEASQDRGLAVHTAELLRVELLLADSFVKDSDAFVRRVSAEAAKARPTDEGRISARRRSRRTARRSAQTTFWKPAILLAACLAAAVLIWRNQPSKQEHQPSKQEHQPSVASSGATWISVHGDVRFATASGWEKAVAGQSLPADAQIKSIGSDSGADLAFADRTRIELSGDTTVSGISDGAGGKRVVLTLGQLRCDAAKQAPEKPMIFSTPQGTALVVGTKIVLAVNPDPAEGTRLDVIEGSVHASDNAGHRLVVDGGNYVLIGTAHPFEVQTVAADEIFLRPRQGKITGDRWHTVDDPTAFDGVALEIMNGAWIENDTFVATVKTAPAGFVEYEFSAEADRPYALWVHGKCTLSDSSRDPSHADFVLIEIPDGTFSPPGQWGSDQVNSYPVNGFSQRKGYWWVGHTKDLTDEIDTPNDPPAVTVTFAERGKHKLRLYIIEAPMRIDAIWLSSTQMRRPQAQQSKPTK